MFWTSLERTGAGYFDYYLLHNIGEPRLPAFDNFGIWDFLRERKEEGLIRHLGFSFHDSPEMLERVLKDHPDMDFVQLQINYADWDNPQVASRENYEICRKHGKPIVIMEPVKGGGLASPPKKVREVFEAADPKASCASWAIRYAASLEGVMTVLSGMSNIAQMEDNLSYMKDFKPLTADEMDVIAKVQSVIKDDLSIACTACHYCTDGCPQQIPIPEIFSIHNKHMLKLDAPPARDAYAAATKGKGTASDCVKCGQCEAACPQGLDIIYLLSTCTAME